MCVLDLLINDSDNISSQIELSNEQYEIKDKSENPA